MSKFRMKQCAVMLLTGIMTLGLFSGCGSKKSSGSGASQAVSGVKLLYIGTDKEDAYRKLLVDSVVAAAKDAGCDLTEAECGNNVEEQVKAAASAKKDGYQAIICRLTDGDTAPQIELAAAGLPIVYVNNEPASRALSKNKYVYVASDESQAGSGETAGVGHSAHLPCIIAVTDTACLVHCSGESAQNLIVAVNVGIVLHIVHLAHEVTGHGSSARIDVEVVVLVDDKIVYGTILAHDAEKRTIVVGGVVDQLAFVVECIRLDVETLYAVAAAIEVAAEFLECGTCILAVAHSVEVAGPCEIDVIGHQEVVALVRL